MATARTFSILQFDVWNQNINFSSKLGIEFASKYAAHGRKQQELTTEYMNIENIQSRVIELYSSQNKRYFKQNNKENDDYFFLRRRIRKF